jgi:hypothetical protein
MDVEPDVPGAICRGRFDASGDRSLAMRIAHALSRVVEVENPVKARRSAGLDFIDQAAW